jgi:probable rRNA maturation factor
MKQEFEISLTNQQSRHDVDERRLMDAARAVLQDSAYSSAAISLAVVNDDTIHELNRRHLEHDWPTDVLSFVLDDDGDHLEGEVVLSADTAAVAAEELGNSAAEEQLLYVIHGMLHLVGCDDKSDADAQKMRAAEARFLQQFGVELSRRAAP